ELMMLAMVRDPVDHSAFDCEAARWQTAGSAICPRQVHGTYDVGRVHYRERPHPNRVIWRCGTAG
ncbi:MAG: hypothetical protein ACOYO9_09300, partial [Candidatus Nanopelagicales bacterium]